MSWAAVVVPSNKISQSMIMSSFVCETGFLSCIIYATGRFAAVTCGTDRLLV